DLLRAGRSILDVGSGDAWYARRLRADLAPAARLSCWDAEYRPEHLETLARWAPGIEFSTARPSHKVDLALLLDVLEHIEDDAAFLGDLARMNLEPGAHVLVSVPAYGSLFTSHDTFLGHHRRYTPSACASLLERNGFTI